MKINDLLNATKTVYGGMKCFPTEKEIKKYILSVYKKELGEFSFKGDIVAGYRSSVGEGDASDYKLQKGDSIILDLLPRKDGVCSDTTRTFFVGKPTDEQVKVYNTVKNALISAEKILRPGISAEEIYLYTREQLKPYEETFFHHAGHLIGFRRLQQPQFLPGKSEKLKVGDIVTLEPGIYIKDKFGVRLENNYLITKSGCKNLFDYPLEIENFILTDMESLI